MRRRNRQTVALVALALAASACGTRLSDSAFGPTGGGTQNTAVGGPGNGDNGDNGLSGLGGGSTPGLGASAGSSSLPGGDTGTTNPGGGGDGTQPGGGSTPGAGGGTQNPGAGGGGGPNTASDRGVTPTSIKVGNIVTKSGIFGPDQFTVSYYGAAAYFADLNAHGGVNGRKIDFVTCDDAGQTDANVSCVNKMINDEKVFAFVANNIYQYAGAKIVSDKDVPDIGGQPIDDVYYQYPHLYTLLGSYYPNNGQKGFGGKTYIGVPGLGQYFKSTLGVTKAALVYYNQVSSARGAAQIRKYLQAVGITVHDFQVNLALPNYNSAVVKMKNEGDQAVFDGLDAPGNAKLCKAMDSNNYHPKAKVSTIAVWTQQIASEFEAPCRNIIYSASNSTNFADTSDPQVAKFQAAYAKYFPGQKGKIAQWSLEGWAAAMWFTDAVRSCGADVTRKCVEAFVNTQTGYGAHGLLDPHTTNFRTVNYPSEKTGTQCYTVVRWLDSKGGWVSVADHHKTCYTLPYFSYPVP